MALLLVSTDELSTETKVCLPGLFEGMVILSTVSRCKSVTLIPVNDSNSAMEPMQTISSKSSEAQTWRQVLYFKYTNGNTVH